MGYIRKFKLHLASLLFSLLISAPLMAADIVIRSNQPVSIATMDFPQYGFFTRNGVDLAVLQFGGSLLGHRIKTMDYGKGCDLRQELDDFIQGLTRQPKTLGLVGPICSGRTRRIVETLSDAQILTISPANTFSGFSDPELHSSIPYYFRTPPNDRFQAETAADFTLSPPSENGLGASTAAIVYYGGDDDYSQFLANGFRDLFTQGGGTIVGDFPIDFGQDLSTVVDTLGDVDVVYAPLFDGEFFSLYTALRETHGDVPLLGTDGVMGLSALEVLGITPVQSYATGVVENGPNLETFVADYTAHYGYPPGPFEAFAYDATRLILNAAAAAASVDASGTLTISTEDMLDYMNDSANYPYAGAGGTYQTPVNGDLNFGGYAVFQDVGGDFLQVFP